MRGLRLGGCGVYCLLRTACMAQWRSHYDLLLAQPVRIARESLLRIRTTLIARPGVAPEDLKRVMSHPVASTLSAAAGCAAASMAGCGELLRHCRQR